MAVKGLLEGWFGGRLGVWGPRTPKLPRAPRNGDPARDVLKTCLECIAVADECLDGKILSYF